MYGKVMPRAFQWRVLGEPERLRTLAAKLLEPADPPDFSLSLAGVKAPDPPDPNGFGSSFALTVGPRRWTLWLSEASYERLRAAGLLTSDDLVSGDLARPDTSF